MTRVMKNSGIEWIGQIPESWSICKTGKLFRNIKEIVKEKSSITERLALTLNGVIKRSKSDAEGLQPEQFNSYQYLRKNQLVFKLIDLENVNTSRVGLCPFEEGMVSPAYIVLKNNQTDNRFYHYYFLSLWHNEIFNHLGGDGVRSALNVKDLLGIPTFSIDTSEQQAIADYLDEKCGKIDSTIENQKKIIEKLKEYKQSLITETVTKGLNPNVKMKDSGIEWIGQIPEHWGVTSIKNVIKGIKDGTHGTFERVSDGEYLLSAKNVFEDGIHIEKNESLISTEDYNSIVSNGYPKKGDILVCCVGTIGRCCIYKEEKSIAFQRSVSFLRTKNIISNRFLLYLLKSNSTQIQLNQMANASAQAGIYMGALKNIKVVFVDDYEEQEMIAEYLDKKCSDIDKAIADKEKLIEKFTEYKKSLIYECVTGKKEIV